jgi:copper chaperone CopZ
VRSTLEALPGVQAVEVSYSEGMARVVFEPQAADDTAVSEAIKSIGYTGHVSE